MNLEECKIEAARLRLDLEKEMDIHRSDEEEKERIQERIRTLETKYRNHLAKAKEADARGGNALKNAEEALLNERVAANIKTQSDAENTRLAEMPDRNRSSLRLRTRDALTSKLSALMQARRKHLSDAYERWGVSLTEGLWNIIPIAAANDSLTGLRRAIQGSTPYTLDDAERDLCLLEAELE